jgi:hypothetical protein
MELISVLLSRAVFLLELDALNPFGRMTPAETMAELSNRYGFAQMPQSIPEITNEKGAECLSGRMGDIAIDKLTLYPNGLVVDTRGSTEDSEKVAQDIIDIAHERLGSKISVGRKHYVSQVTFRSKMRLANMNPVIGEMMGQMKEFLSSGLKQDFLVEPTALIISVDLTQTRISPGKFTIERRAEAPFMEDLYFSSAPLHSAVHLELVENFERSLL